MCVNLVLDKIEIWVYNVHRNPQGGLYTYPRPIFRFPPRVFLGILSEYLAQKYSPELVNKDFGDFLVTVYIVYSIPPVVHAQGSNKIFLYIFKQPFRASLYTQKIPQSLQTFFFGGSRGYFLNTHQQNLKFFLINT